MIQPIVITAVQRQQYRCYPPGLVDLMQEAIYGDLRGLTVKWVMRLLDNPLPNDATVDQWRNHFRNMLTAYEVEHGQAA
jgi:hypothetical protein